MKIKDKEPCQMTREEVISGVKFNYEATSAIRKANIKRKQIALIRHKAQIQQAFSEGKPVPAEVLADYPDLQAKAL